MGLVQARRSIQAMNLNYAPKACMQMNEELSHQCSATARKAWHFQRERTMLQLALNLRRLLLTTLKSDHSRVQL
jgi:hypothetical protein